MQIDRDNAAGAHQRATRARIVLIFCLVSLIWGSTWIVIKDQIAGAPAQWSVAWRFAVAAIGMAGLAAIRRESLRLPRAGLMPAAVIGVTQFSANFQFVYVSEHHLTSGLVAVIYALLLVPNAALSRIFLGTRVGAGFVAGSLLAIAGIGLLLVNEMRIGPHGGSVPLGLALALGGLLCASVANVVQASERARPLAIVPLMFWAMSMGTLANIAFALATDGPPVFDPRPQYVAGIVYLALIGSVIAFPLYSSLIRTMGAGPAAYSGVVVPLVAMALSTLFEGYRWSMLAVGGSALALLGLVIALRARRPLT